MNEELTTRCPKCNAPVPTEAPQGLCPKCLLLAASILTENGQSDETRPAPAMETVAAAFPQLEILEYIGHGGMGYVYKARQPRLDRLVALKLLPLRANAQPAFAERFNREAKVLARLSHPNIVMVHDFGQTTDFCYLVMEFVDGVNLRQVIRGGRLTAAQALALVPKICDALQYAHEEGVLHRDIKPENLLLDARGRIKIADFGIAKLLGESDAITLTASGAAVGTPHYMAPEQLERPQDVDQRADIYSLGVVFYEMLTGELPLGRFAPPSQKSTVDARIDEIVLRTLEKERERRFQNAGDVKTQVENVTSHPQAAPASAQRAQGDGSPAAAAPANGKVRLSWPVKGGAWMVVLSFVGFLIWCSVVSQDNNIQAGPAVFLGLLIVAAATVGNALARGVLAEFYASGVAARGVTVAAFTVVAWPILIVDLAMLVVGTFLVRVLARGPLQHTGVVVILVLALLLTVGGVTGMLLKKWHQNWRALPGEKLLASPLRPLRWMGQMIWGSVGMPVGVLAALFVSLVFGDHSHPPVPPGPSIAMPNPPAGYVLPPGSSPEATLRTYRTSLQIPGGYACTITTTLWSNQVAVAGPKGKSSLYLVVPKGADTEAHLTWRMLGGTRLADGAPVEFSLGVGEEANLLPEPLLIVTPEPISVDWSGEPARIWPPEDGHSKFVLLKGDSEPGAEILETLTQPGDPPQALEVSSFRGPVQWAIGVETRIDAIPNPYQSNLHKPLAGLGSSWMKALETGTPNHAEPSPAAEAVPAGAGNEP